MKPSLGSWRRVYLRMWGDARFRALSPLPPSGQSLFIHFIAGPRTTCIPGIILGGESALAESCRWPLKAFREAYREVLREGLAEGSWGDGLVWVPKAIKYNPPQSLNVIKSWTRTWNDEVPECALKVRIYQDLKAYTEGLPKAFAEAFGHAIAIPSGIQIADRIPPPSESGSSLSSEVRTKRDGGGASRLPDAFALTADLEAHARKHGCRNPAAMLDHFRDYWRAAAGPRAVKADWPAAFRTWARNHRNCPCTPMTNGRTSRPLPPEPQYPDTLANLKARDREEAARAAAAVAARERAS